MQMPQTIALKISSFKLLPSNLPRPLDMRLKSTATIWRCIGWVNPCDLGLVLVRSVSDRVNTWLLKASRHTTCSLFVISKWKSSVRRNEF